MPSRTGASKQSTKHCTEMKPNKAHSFELNKSQRLLAKIKTRTCRDRLLKAQRHTIQLKNLQMHLIDIGFEELNIEEEPRHERLVQKQSMTTTEDDQNFIKAETNVKHENNEDVHITTAPFGGKVDKKNDLRPIGPIKLRFWGLRQF